VFYNELRCIFGEVSPEISFPRESQQRCDVVIVSGAQGSDILLPAQRRIPQGSPAPRKPFAAELPHDEKIGHEARVTAIAVRKRVDQDQPVMKTKPRSRRGIGLEFDPRFGVVKQLAKLGWYQPVVNPPCSADWFGSAGPFATRRRACAGAAPWRIFSLSRSRHRGRAPIPEPAQYSPARPRQLGAIRRYVPESDRRISSGVSGVAASSGSRISFTVSPRTTVGLVRRTISSSWASASLGLAVTRLVLQQHRMLHRLDAPAREQPGPFANHRLQRLVRHQRIDQSAIECRRNAPVMLPVESCLHFRLFEARRRKAARFPSRFASCAEDMPERPRGCPDPPPHRGRDRLAGVNSFRRPIEVLSGIAQQAQLCS